MKVFKQNQSDEAVNAFTVQMDNVEKWSCRRCHHIAPAQKKLAWRLSPNFDCPDPAVRSTSTCRTNMFVFGRAMRYDVLTLVPSERFTLDTHSHQMALLL